MRKWNGFPSCESARYPKAITSPGTASGIITNASSQPRSFRSDLTTTHATPTPMMTASKVAVPAYIRLFWMEGTTSPLPSASM